MKYLRNILFVLASLLFIHSCGQDPTGPDFSGAPAPFDTTTAVSDTTTPDGLTIYTIREGYGAFEVISRDQVKVKYTGRTEDGTIFDSTYRDGFTNARTLQNLTPVPINTGFSQVSPLIDGFRRGIIGMRPGEKRTIVVPPSLGYGDAKEGTNGFDLKDKTLIFDIELVEIVTL